MPKKRINQKRFIPIGQVIDKLLHQYRPANDPELIQVWDFWDESMGAAIAANARPVAFKGRLLLVHVSNSAWLHHLRFLESELIQKLNQMLGTELVRALKFKIGPL